MEYKKAPKRLQQNNSETITKDNDKETPKDTYLQKKDRKVLII